MANQTAQRHNTRYHGKNEKHNLLFTHDNIRIDREIEYTNDTVCLYIEAWFDVEKKFNIQLVEGESVNIYAYITPMTNAVRITFSLTNADGSSGLEHEYTDLLDCESNLIITLADDISLVDTGMTINQYWQYIKEGK